MLLVLLAAPIAATLDTGNITLLAPLAVWAAHFVGPRLGGGLWALASVLKWFPAPRVIVVEAAARTRARWSRWRAMAEPLPYLSVAIVRHARAFLGLAPCIEHPEDAVAPGGDGRP